MTKPVVLITSATSRNGSEAAKLLLAQGKHTVRLAARDPAKLADLVAQGAEAVALDARSAESMAQASAGVDLVYLILPALVGDVEDVMFRNFLSAATGSSVKHVVYLSAIDAVDPAETGFKPIHGHYEHEHVLKRSGVPFTSLRPGSFYENQVVNNAPSIRATGEFKTSAGDGVWTTVAVRDIAAAAVAVLSNPGAHTGKIYTLTTEAVTDSVVAEKVSTVTGQKVRHVNLTPEQHSELILKIFEGHPKREEWATGLVSLDAEKRSNLYAKVQPDLEHLIGRKGVPLETFLAENADAFKQQPKTSA
jgi:uncharacterized protein YbjT (DUF2867 family)